jgi:two-component system sensor histidine kinase KdpD
VTSGLAPPAQAPLTSADSSFEEETVPPSDRLGDRIRREARVVGLRDVRAPSLETVERRRMQLWFLTAILLVSLSLGVVIVSLWPSGPGGSVASTPVLRFAVVIMSAAFCVYAVEKEMHLRRLSSLLVDERVLTAALTSRLREVSLLLDAGKAINAVLDLPIVLDTILGSALELLGGTSGSVMLLEGEELVAACVHGNEDARGVRTRLGEGIAGHVAMTREPLLIDGQADASAFPGLNSRQQPVDSAISVPLVNRASLVGVLNVNAAAGRVFTEYDLRAIALFAEQAAIAIANARLYETERVHVEELTELNHVKNEFVALVSHELRTPIASIIGAVSTAQRPELQDDRDEFDDIIDRQARRLAAMVEDLLTSARIERGEMELRTESIDLAELVRVAATDFSVTDRMVDVVAPDHLEVIADREALRRVIDNLLDNAFKHGAPPVVATVREDDRHVVLTVADSGHGIAEGDRQRVFDRFHRLEANRWSPGLGLGLSVVRELVLESGGSIWIDESAGGGAAFSISLPVVQESSVAQGA